MRARRPPAFIHPHTPREVIYTYKMGRFGGLALNPRVDRPGQIADFGSIPRFRRARRGHGSKSRLQAGSGGANPTLKASKHVLAEVYRV